jgi:hypothetical protein
MNLALSDFSRRSQGMEKKTRRKEWEERLKGWKDRYYVAVAIA